MRRSGRALMDRATFFSSLSAFHTERGQTLAPDPLLGVRIDLYDMFLVAMQQGGFPRVNKNNKWGFLGKQLGVIPKEKAPSQQEIEQVKRFYVRWIRPFEGEKVSPELRKQLQPPGLELPRRGAAAGGATSAPYSAAAAAASGTNSNLSQQLAVGPAGQPQKYPHHHMLPQQQHLQQLQEEQELQEHVKGSEADVLSNKVKAERRAALQQRHAAADIFRLIRRRDRLAAKYSPEAVAARLLARERRRHLVESGQLGPATDVRRLTQSLADRRYAPGDFPFAVNCLYYLSRPLRGISLEQHPGLLYEVSLLLEEAAAACREGLLSLHRPREPAVDLPQVLGCIYNIAATPAGRAADAAAPLDPMDILQPQLLLLPGVPWSAATSNASSKAGPLLALHALQLASALSANLLLPVENRLYLAGYSRASIGPLLLAGAAAQRSNGSNSNSYAVFEAAVAAAEDAEEIVDSDGEWVDHEEEQDQASEVSGALTRQGRVFRRPESPADALSRPPTLPLRGSSGSSSSSSGSAPGGFPEFWGGPLKEERLEEEGANLKAAAAALLSAVDCVAVAALRTEKMMRVAASRAAAATAQTTVAGTVTPRSATLPRVMAAPAGAGAAAFVKLSAAELLEGLIKEKEGALGVGATEAASSKADAVEALRSYSTRWELRQLLQLQIMLGLEPPESQKRQQQQQQHEQQQQRQEQQKQQKEEQGRQSKRDSFSIASDDTSAVPAATKRLRTAEEEVFTDSSSANAAPAVAAPAAPTTGTAVGAASTDAPLVSTPRAVASSLPPPTPTQNFLFGVPVEPPEDKQKQQQQQRSPGTTTVPVGPHKAHQALPQQTRVQKFSPGATSPSGTAVAAAVLQQQLQEPPSSVAVLLQDATEFVVVHMQQHQQPHRTPLSVPAAAGAGYSCTSALKKSRYSSDASCSGDAAATEAAAAADSDNAVSVQSIAEALQQAVQLLPRPLQLVLMRRAAAIFSACNLRRDSSSRRMFVLLRLLQQLGPQFAASLSPLVNRVKQQIVTEEEAVAETAAAAAAAPCTTRGTPATSAAGVAATITQKQQQQLQEMLFLDFASEAEALSPFLSTATSAAKAFSAIISLLPPSYSVCPGTSWPPQSEHEQKRRDRGKKQISEEPQPEESWIGLAAAASLARLLRCLQAEAGVRLPRSLLNAKGLQFLQAAFETAAQLLLFRQSVLGPHMDVFLSVAAALLQIEVELPRLRVPRSLIRAALSFLYLTCTSPPRLLLSCLEALVAAHAACTATAELETSAAAGSHNQPAETATGSFSKASVAEAAAKLFLTPLLRYIRHKMMEAARLSAQEELAEAISPACAGAGASAAAVAAASASHDFSNSSIRLPDGAAASISAHKAADLPSATTAECWLHRGGAPRFMRSTTPRLPPQQQLAAVTSSARLPTEDRQQLAAEAIAAAAAAGLRDSSHGTAEHRGTDAGSLEETVSRLLSRRDTRGPRSAAAAALDPLVAQQQQLLQQKQQQPFLQQPQSQQQFAHPTQQQQQQQVPSMEASTQMHQTAAAPCVQMVQPTQQEQENQQEGQHVQQQQLLQQQHSMQQHGVTPSQPQLLQTQLMPGMVQQQPIALPPMHLHQQQQQHMQQQQMQAQQLHLRQQPIPQQLLQPAPMAAPPFSPVPMDIQQQQPQRMPMQQQQLQQQHVIQQQRLPFATPPMQQQMQQQLLQPQQQHHVVPPQQHMMPQQHIQQQPFQMRSQDMPQPHIQQQQLLQQPQQQPQQLDQQHQDTEAARPSLTFDYSQQLGAALPPSPTVNASGAPTEQQQQQIDQHLQQQQLQQLHLHQQQQLHQQMQQQQQQQLLQQQPVWLQQQQFQETMSNQAAVGTWQLQQLQPQQPQLQQRQGMAPQQVPTQQLQQQQLALHANQQQQQSSNTVHLQQQQRLQHNQQQQQQPQQALFRQQQKLLHTPHQSAPRTAAACSPADSARGTPAAAPAPSQAAAGVAAFSPAGTRKQLSAAGPPASAIPPATAADWDDQESDDEEGEGVNDATAVAVGCIGALASSPQLLPLLRPHLPLLTELAWLRTPFSGTLWGVVGELLLPAIEQQQQQQQQEQQKQQPSVSPAALRALANLGGFHESLSVLKVITKP
ncbi:ARID/BRIGHT DNA-binding domain-containing protein, putative [Eimeria tenella]|uniref:ARID/BRIGHT DNA-binding domain-containing protein, putative n=1 Tax=Eimeria tenella TaxID=5802 RepID=U6LB84_EIMTE|nr:ARID/BRIGHT DNA-binding domain-containing protein, putative [Eimeria tenella]CDJ45015.1 ARID/BRIGHT DNA-binding domain-containing protein, putative [Eimeria tenella]|eukprot:XP_013235762.1 ARID/BRIGHT DNA-binding domain-containing protein, putative [Eimeria tenella]